MFRTLVFISQNGRHLRGSSDGRDQKQDANA